jgi:hypothetical protein
MEQVKILTSRRAYEFRIDDIRLSMLSTKPVQEQIQHHFHFQNAAMGIPIATFGEVPSTYPPGVVFDMGVWPTAEQQLIPIRFLHFDQRRIVIDVAGPSSAIDEIYRDLQNFLSSLQTSDGYPIIGEPENILDYSEFAVQFSCDISTLLPPSIKQVFSRYVRETSIYRDKIAIPLLCIAPLGAMEKFGGAIPGDYRTFTLTLRAGTRLEDAVFFSGAPLSSERHREYIADLATVLENQ